MKTRKMPVLIVAVVVLLAAATWLVWQHFQTATGFSDIGTGNGRIEAVQVDVTSKIAGRVEAVLAQEGDLVVAGDELALIDTDQLNAELARAQAEVASAEAAVAATRAAIDQAQAEETLAELQFNRASQLVERGSISRESFDTTSSQRNVASAKFEAAQAQLVSSQRGVDAARAAVQEIQTQIDDATLVATARGRVLYRLAEPGEVVGSGGKVLTVIDLTNVYMQIYLPSSQVQRIAIGAEARIKLDVLNFALPATVTFVSPESQFTPKEVETASEREKLMFRVKLRLPESLVLEHIESVKTGVRGVGYVRLTSVQDEKPSAWPDAVAQLPPGYSPDRDTTTEPVTDDADGS